MDKARIAIVAAHNLCRLIYIINIIANAIGNDIMGSSCNRQQHSQKEKNLRFHRRIFVNISAKLLLLRE